ncbi:hypothetical protein GCM10010234_75040 [Streptomyces hawaiiensis]
MRAPLLPSALVAARDDEDRLTEGELVCTAGRLPHPQQPAGLREHPELMPNADEKLMRYQHLGDGAACRILLEDMTLRGRPRGQRRSRRELRRQPGRGALCPRPTGCTVPVTR